jgi:hypothetical protein
MVCGFCLRAEYQLIRTASTLLLLTHHCDCTFRIMKNLNKTLSLLLLGFLTCTTVGYSQSGSNCSARFTITYPSNAPTAVNGTITQTINNGTGDFNSTYCPTTATATASQLIITPTSNILYNLYRGSGTDTVRVARMYLEDGMMGTLPLPINSVSTIYTLRSDLRCNNPKTNLFTLTLAPSLSVVATVNGTPVNSAVCPGTSVTVTGTGASAGSTYFLKDASGTVLQQNQTGIFQVTPTKSMVYTVTTNTPSCGTADVIQQIQVDVNNLTLAASATTVTANTSVTLTAGGGSAYTFTATAANGNTTTVAGSGNTRTVSPARTTTYTVTGPTAVGGCPGSATVTISVGTPLPVELKSFTATWKGQSPWLQWTTASEKDNAYSG